MPAKRSALCAAMPSTSASSASSLVTPQRCCPASTSGSTSIVTPARAAASPSACDLRQRIHAYREPHMRCELDCHRKLVRADELVADMNARDARRRERIRLRQLLTAHADRARSDLTPRDLAGLVRFRMRTQRDAMARGERRHRREIGVEGIEIDHQRRRGDRCERVAHAGGGWRSERHGGSGR